MNKYVRYLTRGLAVVGVITATIPKICMDGKVTVEELAEFTKAVCEAGGWKTSFKVPDELKGVDIGVIADG